MVLSTLVFVALAAIGIQGWQIITAIMEAEQASVIPLPPGDQLGGAAAPWSTEPPSTAGLVADTSRSVPASLAESDAPAVGGVQNEVDSGNDAASGSESGEAESPSRLDITRALVDAGIAGGDPGRSSIWNGADSLYILVLGVDRRADGGDQNADVIIIARLDLIDQTLTGVSVPRDLLIDIPGVGPNKINGAYNYGVLAAPDDPVAGVAMVRDTVEHVFGVTIDGYVLVDFSGFEDVVDALGGIDVNVPYRIVDDEYPTEDYRTEVVTFEAGLQHMDGEEALKYVRTRHADSDNARRERQIEVIKSVLEQGQSLSSIANADELIVTAGGAIQTSFTLEEQLTLARIARSMAPEKVSIVTLEEPLLQSDWTSDGRWVYTADEAALREFVQAALAVEP